MAKKHKPKEKTIKIGKRRIKTGTLCVAALVLILTVSSAGFIASQLSGAGEQEQFDFIQARVIVSFGNLYQKTEIINLTEERTAEAAFRKVADLDTEYTASGVVATSVSIGDVSATRNETHMWVFYVNARINFNGLDRYQVNHADTIELRFEKKPY